MRKIYLLAGLTTCFLQSAFGQTELIVNGSFDTGNVAPWHFGGSIGAHITNNPAFARSGTQSLTMGNGMAASQSVYQTITIPSNAVFATLSYYWNVSSQNTSQNPADFDQLGSMIVSTNGSVLASVLIVNNLDTDSVYHLKTYDLEPFIGQTVRIHFQALTKFFGSQTSFHIEDVSVLYVTTNDLPKNDYFTNRTVLTNSSFTITATNMFASKEPGEPKHANNNAAKSLWWTWTAPTNGTVSLKTDGSSFDTVLAVYTGSSVSNLTSVAADNNDGNGLASSLRFPAIGGTQYQIAVDGDDGAFGTIVLNLSFQPDNKVPIISITSPESGAKLTNATVVVKGKASDNLGVDFVEFRLENSAGTNAYEPAAGSNAWSATVTGLVPGINTVRVRAHDISGNVSPTTTRQFNHVVVSPLTQTQNGSGAVTPNLNGKLLEVGANYTLKASPGAGYIFASWTGDLTSENPTLAFTMQSNLVLQANFIPNPFIPVAGNYQGLFYDTNGVTHESSGFLSAKITSSGSFTAKLLVAGKSYSRSGKFSATGAYSNSIPRTGLSPISIQLQLDLNGGNVLTGQLSDGSWNAELTANRAPYSKINLAPQAGKYTLLLPQSSAQPGGNGFGTVTIGASGTITFAGTLGDGTKAAQAALLSEPGQWPLYVSLYAKQGSILGWLTVTNGPGMDISGPVNWIKLAQPGSLLYPAGFTNEIGSIGSTYQFTSGIPVLNLTTGQVFFVNGNLSEPFTNQVALSAASKVTNLSSNSLNLAITTSSGLFKGSVVNPATGKTISFSGAILQNMNAGYGVFRGTNETGGVYFGQ